jgi:hypothetical protein
LPFFKRHPSILAVELDEFFNGAAAQYLENKVW